MWLCLSVRLPSFPLVSLCPCGMRRVSLFVTCRFSIMCCCRFPVVVIIIIIIFFCFCFFATNSLRNWREGVALLRKGGARARNREREIARCVRQVASSVYRQQKSKQLSRGATTPCQKEKRNKKLHFCQLIRNVMRCEVRVTTLVI